MGLQAPPPDVTSANVTLSSNKDSDETIEVGPAVRVRGPILLRTALNVIFGIFPSAGGDGDGDQVDAGPALVAKTRNRAKTVGVTSVQEEVDVSFGARVKRSRYKKYREFSMKASAWISTALRKLRAGRHYVKKWFILPSEITVDAQIREARRHLTRMLQLMSRFAIIKGLPRAEGGACSSSLTGGVLAYVVTKDKGCGVNSRFDCGQKERTGRHIINICEFYWNGLLDSKVRIGTIVHESSHHFGTRDEGYCDQLDCLALSSREARNNADTYTKLVQELVADRRLPEASDGSQTYPVPTVEPSLCPQNSLRPTPNQDGDCTCSNGYVSSFFLLSKRDRYGRQWFPVTCSGCKCYPVQQPVRGPFFW